MEQFAVQIDISVKERIAACLAVFIKRSIPAGGFGRGGTRTPDGGMDYEGKKLAPGMIQSLGAGDLFSAAQHREIVLD